MPDKTGPIKQAKAMVERVMADNHAGYAAIDMDGWVLSCNAAFAAMLGRTPDEVRGTDLPFYFRESYRAKARDWLADAANDRPVSTRELVGFMDAGGDTRMVDLTASILRTEKDAPGCVLLAGWDVTQILQRWSRTKDAKNMLELALEANKIGTWEHDVDTDAFQLDETAEKIFGHAPGTYPHTYFRDHLSAHHPIPVDDKIQEALGAFASTADQATETALTVRIRRIQRADGSAIWMRLAERRIDHPVIFGAKKIIGTVQDVDEEVSAFIDLWEARQSLERSTTLIDTATDASAIGLWRIVPENNECWFSESWFSALGYAPGDFPHTIETFERLLHPDDAARVLESYRQSLSSDDGQYAGDFRLRRKDGSYAWIGSSGQRIPDKNVPGGIALVGAQIDISDRVEAKEKVERTARDAQETLRRLEYLTDNVPGGIYEFHLSKDGALSFPFHTKGFADLIGSTQKEVAEDPHKAFRFVHRDDIDPLNASIVESAEKLCTWKHTYRLNHPTAGLRWVRGRSTPVGEADGGTRWYGCLLDVTEEVLREQELEKAKQRTEQQSLRDPLTELPNRRAFDNAMVARYEDRRSQARRHTIIRIDLDHFKFVNDTLGHAAGDAVLVHVAQILRENVRSKDLAARVGGDEFVILMGEDQNTDDAMEVIDRVRRALKRPFMYEGRHCRFDASFGVASNAPLPEDPGELLSFADAALYQAKQAGRGRVMVFTPELHAELIRVRTRAVEIQNALEASEFVPFFHPQIDAVTGEISGCEVLARWQHPTEGLIGPDEFIPVAEQIRVVQDIDRTVFLQALDMLERFRVRGLTLPKLSFNVSVGRILDPDIIRSVRTLQTHGTQVAFELLESILLEEEGALFGHHLDLLKECGIDIEVDDFGSGRASIIGVMRVVPNTIKIDKRLIEPMVDDASMRGLVGAIIDIGRTLEIDVTAEGVETMEHAQLLREMGCKTLQGFAFSKPMPESQLRRYLADFRPFRDGTSPRLSA